MSTEALALLIARMGIEFAIEFLTRSKKDGGVTVEDLEELRLKYARTKEQIQAEARAALGLPPV